ncbi:MAG: hypothetical protein H6510_16650 [Acidobacteria bacterium]|nr:hypothetical protein [Acidobacteriota bacterium]MCB9399445.1 hypothetical protein [Acidobacteriota bacterium]
MGVKTETKINLPGPVIVLKDESAKNSCMLDGVNCNFSENGFLWPAIVHTYDFVENKSEKLFSDIVYSTLSYKKIGEKLDYFDLFRIRNCLLKCSDPILFLDVSLFRESRFGWVHILVLLDENVTIWSNQGNQTTGGILVW